MWQLRCIATRGRFNYDAHAKFEVAQFTYPLPSYSILLLNADTLRYVVTLTFDPVILAFDVVHV